MKICPVCNESFADQLNFCDIDGVRLAREGSSQERNKWWSLLGAALLVGALVISAMSIIFMPKARVSAPIVNSEAQSPPAPNPQPSIESPATVAAAPELNTEPSAPADVMVPEAKKKDRALTNDVNAPAPNPKAVFTDEADKKLSPIDVNTAAQPSAKTSEALTPVGDARTADPAPKPQPPVDLKKDSKDQPVNAKGSDDKKKTDEKDKKKGGFLRVFKKIFGKD
jgi:hypothetical protein